MRTFRDPAGSLLLLEDAAHRRVAGNARAEVLAFLGDERTRAAVEGGQLIRSDVVPNVESSGDSELELLHPLVEFPSYCWEWAPAMWLQAAELTLDLASEMLAGGWMMKDAAPHNVLFRGVRPVFVDVLSFERWDGRTVWPAYGQFVRTFLLPMLAHSRLGWPLAASLMRRDGFEPEEIYEGLGWLGRVRPGALGAVTLPRVLGRFGGRPGAKAPFLSNPEFVGLKPHANPKDPDVAVEVLRATMAGLGRQMRRSVPVARRSQWSEYVVSASHYAGEDHAAKQAFVERVVAAERPEWVLDVGSNTGTYSMIAVMGGAEVVAIDADVQAVDRLAREAAESGGAAAARILPLCVDLAQPTPGAGWENRESLSFLERASGKFDMVMMLAVAHHLLLTSQIPLKQIAEMCARLTTRGLLIEWVPPGDPMFRELVRGRDALYAGITEGAFRAAMAEGFEVREEKRLGNGRLLMHLRRRG